jgi:carbamoyl-phosphate synthase large subunit
MHKGWILKSAVCSLSSYSWLKIFKTENFRICGVDITDWCKEVNLFDEFYKVKKASYENETDVIYDFQNLVKKYNPLWIISGPENEIELLLKHEKDFLELGTAIFHSPIETVKLIKNKFKMYKFLDDKITRFKIPHFSLLSHSNTNKFLSSISKFIVKPCEGRGSSDIYIAENQSDLYNILSLIDSRNNIDKYIIQEFINGIEISVDVLFDNEGTLLSLVPRKRILTESGIAIVTETFFDSNLVDIIYEISNILKFRYINNFQFILRDDCYYLIDINPRFGGASVISYYASESFRANILFLLTKEFDRIKIDLSSPKIMKMIRFYQELYFHHEK